MSQYSKGYTTEEYRYSVINALIFFVPMVMFYLDKDKIMAGMAALAALFSLYSISLAKSDRKASLLMSSVFNLIIAVYVVYSYYFASNYWMIAIWLIICIYFIFNIYKRFVKST